MGNFSSGLNLTQTHVEPSVAIVPLQTWLAVSAVVSILGSLLIITLFASLYLTDQRAHSGSRILVLHYLVTEFLNLVVTFNIAIAIMYNSQLDIDYTVNCEAVAFLQMLLTYVGHWAAAWLAINRLTAMIFPLRYRVITSKLSITLNIISCWVIGFVCAALPVFKVGGYYRRFYSNGYCSFEPTDLQPFTVIITMGGAVPLGVEGICYLWLWFMSVVVPKLKKERQSDAMVSGRKKQQLLGKLLALSYLWYLFCLTPLPLVSAFAREYIEEHVLPLLWMWTIYMCGPVGTPMILIGLSSYYRSTVKNMLWRLGGRIGPSSSQVPSMRTRTITASHISKKRPSAWSIPLHETK